MKNHKHDKHTSHDPEANRRYHDRVAPKYDDIYSGPRWEVWREITWDGIKRWIPRDLNAPIADLGCGTGEYGLRLAKSGFKVTLSDLSHGMLEAARRKAVHMDLAERVKFQQADLMDLNAFDKEHFALVLAQGDPLSFASHPPKALKEIRRILQPGGVLAASVDQTYAALLHYCEKGDLDGLDDLIRGGRMEWLAHDPNERFPVHTFTAESLREDLERAGFEVLDIFGKTVLPLKKLDEHWGDPKRAEKLLELEKRLCRKPSALGLASHLQFAARKKE